jgi:hypothetical protein
MGGAERARLAGNNLEDHADALMVLTKGEVGHQLQRGRLEQKRQALIWYNGCALLDAAPRPPITHPMRILITMSPAIHDALYHRYNVSMMNWAGNLLSLWMKEGCTHGGLVPRQ